MRVARSCCELDRATGRLRGRSDRRGSGLGEAGIRWAIDEAREQDCRLVQLTTNANRVDARRCYERVGFEASHVGVKSTLDQRQESP